MYPSVHSGFSPPRAWVSQRSQQFFNSLLGPQELKGISTAQSLYQVQGESDVQNRFEVAVRSGLTPLVGREEQAVQKYAEEAVALCTERELSFFLAIISMPRGLPALAGSGMGGRP